MAHCATPGLPGTRKGILPAKTVAAAVLACRRGLLGVLLGPQRDDRTGDHVQRHASALSRLHACARHAHRCRDVSGLAAVDVAAVAEGRNRRPSCTRSRTSGRASYLRVVIHVHDKDGVPLRSQQVIVSWRSRGVRTVESAVTNDRGDASVDALDPCRGQGRDGRRLGVDQHVRLVQRHVRLVRAPLESRFSSHTEWHAAR